MKNNQLHERFGKDPHITGVINKATKLTLHKQLENVYVTTEIQNRENPW